MTATQLFNALCEINTNSDSGWDDKVVIKFNNVDSGATIFFPIVELNNSERGITELILGQPTAENP